jgi:hypothetical protein
MKLYSEKEIGAILKRAAELSMSEAGSNAGGLSLEELQQIGREAGIDPDLILKAASELQNYAPRASGTSLVDQSGMPMTSYSKAKLTGQHGKR